MTVVMQKTKQKIMALCRLLLEIQRYSVAENGIGFESDYFKGK